MGIFAVLAVLVTLAAFFIGGFACGASYADKPQDELVWRYLKFKISDDGMLLRQDLGDPTGTWYAIMNVWS